MVDERLQFSDLFSLKNKTAFITGGSGGIGLMLAKGMLVNGARVIISSRKNQRITK